MALDDTSPMPYGIYEGVAMANVPANYLLNLYEKKKACAQVRAYVEENLDVLKIEVKRNSNKK